MNNYSKNIYTKFLDELDPLTGEISKRVYKEVKDFKKTIKRGAQMIYVKNIEDAIVELNGKKEIKIFFYAVDQFKKNKKESLLDQKRIAKKFDTTQQYVSRVINKLLSLNVLMKVKNRPMSIYRLNPYLILTPFSDGVELQDEWDILTNAPIKIKDKFEYLTYIGSNKWKEFSNRLKQERKICNICNSTNNLEAHHLTYDNIYNEKDEDIQILCHNCHALAHSDD